MQVRVSPEVGAVLDQAESISLRRGAAYVGVEHLFEAIVSDPLQLPKQLHRHGALFHSAVERVYREAWRGEMPETSGEVFHTPRYAVLVHDTLTVINGSEDGTEFALTQRSFTLGSDSSCAANIRLDGSVREIHARAWSSPKATDFVAQTVRASL